jgi:hypothetical protein
MTRRRTGPEVTSLQIRQAILLAKEVLCLVSWLSSFSLSSLAAGIRRGVPFAQQDEDVDEECSQNDPFQVTRNRYLSV